MIKRIAFWIVAIAWAGMSGFLVLSVPVALWMLMADFSKTWHVVPVQLMLLAGTVWLLYKLLEWLDDPTEYYPTWPRGSGEDCVVTPEENEAELDKLEARFSKGAF